MAQGLDPGRGKSFFVFSKTCRTALGTTQNPTQWVPGSFPVVKRPGSVVNHSPPTSTEAKNVWSYTSTPICLQEVEFFSPESCIIASRWKDLISAVSIYGTAKAFPELSVTRELNTVVTKSFRFISWASSFQVAF
jgi:hypothetical protein